MDIFEPKFIYCLSYVKFISNFCYRELKSEFAEIRRNFRTKDLNIKLDATCLKPRRCDRLQVAEFIDSTVEVFLTLSFAKLTEAVAYSQRQTLLAFNLSQSLDFWLLDSKTFVQKLRLISTKLLRTKNQ